ncbi:hypothetical protein [Rufibacter roseus]|uniref:Uncharacterized protein n=1 Tax=Rufibacter roseus TaxID=1567108 RepID=A0ABW2DKU1_9BACT|nr:hypothetical protein [Rufibacter roseus]
MLYTLKRTDEYNSMAKQVINYVEKSGYEDVKADFSGYDSPAALTMVSQGITLTPDFTAKRGDSKYYFELVVKTNDDKENSTLVSKWKALESIAKMKGGSLNLFVPHGSYKFATSLLKDYNIEADLIKMSDL